MSARLIPDEDEWIDVVSAGLIPDKDEWIDVVSARLIPEEDEWIDVVTRERSSYSGAVSTHKHRQRQWFALRTCVIAWFFRCCHVYYATSKMSKCHNLPEQLAHL